MYTYAHIGTFVGVCRSLCACVYVQTCVRVCVRLCAEPCARPRGCWNSCLHLYLGLGAAGDSRLAFKLFFLFFSSNHFQNDYNVVFIVGMVLQVLRGQRVVCRQQQRQQLYYTQCLQSLASLPLQHIPLVSFSSCQATQPPKRAWSNAKHKGSTPGVYSDEI